MIQSNDDLNSHKGLSQFSEMVMVNTNGKGFYEFTRILKDRLNSFSVLDGLLTVFICHTSASLVIQENADPDVVLDLDDGLDRLAPRSHNYRHSYEGPDDMPAHIRSMITSTSIGIPVQNSEMVFGTWQGIYVAEHRDQPHRRKIALHYIGTIIQ